MDEDERTIMHTRIAATVHINLFSTKPFSRIFNSAFYAENRIELSRIILFSIMMIIILIKYLDSHMYHNTLEPLQFSLFLKQKPLYFLGSLRLLRFS